MNVQQPAAPVSNGIRNGGAPIGGVTPSGGPMPVGGSMPQQPIMSSGTEDIVLSGGNSNTEKKSHKGVIILIVLMVLLVLVGGGVLLWQNGAFGGAVYKASTNLTTNLREFVNYMYAGELSSEPLVGMSDDTEYKFEEVFYSNDVSVRSEYYSKADEMLINSTEILLGNENDAASNYNRLITDISSNFYLVSNVAKIDGLSMEYILSDYINGKSVQELKEIVEDRYGLLLKTNDDALEMYAQAYIDYYNMRIDELNLIAQNDCLGYVSDWAYLDGLSECPTLDNFLENIKTLEEKTGKLGFNPSGEKISADDMVKTSIKNLTNGLYGLNEELAK